jgi:hypothetical protein
VYIVQEVKQGNDPWPDVVAVDDLVEAKPVRIDDPVGLSMASTIAEQVLDEDEEQILYPRSTLRPIELV